MKRVRKERHKEKTGGTRRSKKDGRKRLKKGMTKKADVEEDKNKRKE